MDQNRQEQTDFLKEVACWKKDRPGKGECCCNCRYLYPFYSHPWVDGKSISNQVGWLCLGLWEDSKRSENPPSIKGPELSREHGLCELHEYKDGYVETECLCSTKCDCQYPPPDDWDGKGDLWLISNECPIHNDNPQPSPECPIHGRK